MKALIDYELRLENEYKQIDTKILEEFSVQYKTFEDNDEVVIVPQKIDLEQEDMNTLFDEVFYDDVNIVYVNLGGRGCDFCISITAK